jgi:hypothetical protein
LLELLAKVEEQIKKTSGINYVKAQEVDSNKSEFLKIVSQTKALAFSQSDKNIYFIDSDGIYSLDKGGKNKKQIIKNDSYWKNPSSVISYLSNIYVLDKTKGGVIKFIGGKNGFGETKYFADSEPDLTTANSMAIDGSIYLLLADGTILKYTKGKSDNFNILGLDTPFSNPQKIYTSIDFEYLYILDSNNSRIVVLDKSGNYKLQYSSEILKSAKELEVLEKENKIYVLSSNKIYQVDLK